MSDKIRKRIIIGDDRDPRFPVQAFFNSINDRNFVGIISSLLEHIGYCTDNACCTFPSDLDPCEAMFKGVRFSLFEDIIIIDRKSFMECLKVVCIEHIEHCPSDREEVTNLLRSNLIVL